jgi:DNA-binding transcriptional regulator/RsmH inhibitor MraZ
MMGGRTEVSLDPQSRLAIPKHLREHSGLADSQSAVIVGQGLKFEIWAKKIWDEFTIQFTSENMFSAAEAAGLAKVV